MGIRRLSLEVRPPFRLDLTVWALRRRPHNTVDSWDGTTYRRTLLAGGAPVAVAVRQEPDDCPDKARLAVEVRRRVAAPSDAALDEVQRRLGRMLGLGLDLAGFSGLARNDGRLDELARRFVGVRPPRFPTVFETLVNAVACQQVSLTVGIHLLDRLAHLYGPTAGVRGSAPGFPSAERLAEAQIPELRRLGFSHAKARAISLLAPKVASGALDLEHLEHLDDNKALAALVALPGIGRWSAEYVLLRGLGRLHVLPGDDVGARNNLRRRFGLPVDAGYDEVARVAAQWRPYGGMVYFHLLLDGLAGSGHLAADDSSVPRIAAATEPAADLYRGEVA
ncbi:MAG: DNA-3-methyladenine glycosylase family protein [Acidimicrobiales bacterium]